MVEIHIRHGQASPQTGVLTDEGRDQAKMAGEYLKREFPRVFEVGLHSGSTRAKDTARLLALGVDWAVDKRLREKTGESWEAVIERVGTACEEMGALHQGKDRLLVYHGDAMHAARVYRESLTGDRFARVFEEPYKYFNNCQLIIYTNEDPATGAVRSEKLWVRSVCPWAEGRFGHDWMLVDKYAQSLS